MAVDVSVLVLSESAFERYDYFLKWLVAAWRADGHRVHVQESPAAAAAADLVVCHLDATSVDPRRTAALADHPRVVNRSNADIAKRRISRQLVSRPADHDGPVIVKTDRNHGGVPERRRTREGSFLGRCADRLRRALPWPVSGALLPGDYRVYSHPSLVPWPVWRNPALVVEKFLPERGPEGGYRLRHHFFFGSRQCDYLLTSGREIVKSNRVSACAPVPATPGALPALRTALALDYGRIDYVLHGEQPVIFDVNRTPAFSLLNSGFPHEEVGRHLAAGLADLLAAGGRNH